MHVPLRGNGDTGPDSNDYMNNYALSTVESVSYLAVTFSNSAKWNTHVGAAEEKQLQRLSTPAERIRNFVEVRELPLIPYYSSVIFAGLLKHDFALLKRSIKLTSPVCGLRFSYFACERHKKASSDFVERILGDYQHFLNEDLSKEKSHTCYRSSFKLRPSKTAAHRTLSSRRYYELWLTETKS